MTEGNFVDYVKIHLTSGKGGVRIYVEKSIYQKEVPMVVMVVVVVI